ncbi:MAG: DUF58 domain-containing protein, partial [Nitrospirae bacterium]|nr:DUF58 domain-containing protein [Nitrospirota bacterium]
LNKVSNRRAVVFIISDFHAPEYSRALSIANKRHDVIAVTLTDPVELALPKVGLITLEDAETGELFYVDTSSAAVRNQYKYNASVLFAQRKRLFQKSGVDHIEITTDVPYIKTLIRFFRMRERRLSR